MKVLIIVSNLLIFQPAFGGQLSCEGWYQALGGPLERLSMPISTESENNTVFNLSNRGYYYRVDWDKGLTSFYITIEFEGKRILFTTARVPTENHPENFTDLNLPGGPRLSVNCEVK